MEKKVANQKMMTDFLNKDLAGFSLRKVYFVEIAHRQFDPLFAHIVHPEDEHPNEFFVCESEELLQKVIPLLPKEETKTFSSYALVNDIFLFAFIMEIDIRCQLESAQSVKVLTEADLKKDLTFTWAEKNEN